MRQRREIGALAVVAEERVQDLFHVTQVRLDFARHLRQDESFLRPPRHLVEDGRDGGARYRLTLRRGVEPREHRIDLLRKLGRYRGEVIECGVGEQQAGGVFHCQRVRHVTGGELVETARKRRREPRKRRFADGGGLVAQLRQDLAQLRQIFGAAAGKLEPEILRGSEQIARFAQQRLHADDIGRQHVRARNQAMKAECALDCLHLRSYRRADRDVIQHLAPHPVGDFCRAFDEAPDLQVDATAQLLDAERALDAFFDDAFEQRANRPPDTNAATNASARPRCPGSHRA